MNTRKTRNVRILFGLTFAGFLMAAIAVTATLGLRRLVQSSGWVERTHEAIEAIERVYSDVKGAEASQRGFLLTGKVEFEEEFLAAVPRARDAAGAVARAVRDNPEQSARAALLGKLVDERLQIASNTAQQFRDGGMGAIDETLKRGHGSDVMRQLQRQRDLLIGSERDLLGERSARTQADVRWLRLSINLGSALGLAFLALAAWRMLREIAQRSRAEERTGRANLELTSSMQELRTRSEQTRELSRYAGMLQSCRNVDEAIAITRDAMLRLLPETGGALYLLRASQDIAEQLGSWGSPAAASLPVLASADCWALRRGRTYEIADVHNATRCAHVQLPPQGQPASSLCVPLTAHGETMGFIYFSSAHDGTRGRRDLALAAAEQLSLALSNLRLQDSLRVQSIRDPLTGLFNRRYLEESLERELSRCGRRNLPLSVMMIDLDHFKRYNDTHGHAGGDTLLTHFGTLLQSHCRGEDIACRFGGEEFILILPEMGAESALERAGHLRASIEALKIEHLRQTLSPVTASIGVASFPVDATTAEKLLRCADAALYRAKRAGRNCAVLAQTDEVSPPRVE